MSRVLNYVLTFTILLASFQLIAQQAIKEKVQQNAQQISSSKLHQVFENANESDLNNEISEKVLSQKQFLKINAQPFQSIITDKSSHLRVNLSVEGQLMEFRLFEADIFTPDFHTVTSSGNIINAKTGLHYWGIVSGKPNSLVALSFFDNEIAGLIHVDGASYNINKYKDTDYHLLYKNTDLNFQPDFNCSAIPVKPSQNVNDINMEHAIPEECVRIHIEADYSLYQSKGSSIANTTNYINGVFSQVAIMFANESITIAISYLNIWSTPSPYGNGTELDDLNAQAYGRTYGDLVHVIHRNGGGGVAYLGVLCNSSFNTGASGVNGSYNNVPTYSWDVNVITHELGHNFGSPHTHACSWNGNNTAIDGCGDTAGYSEGCSGPTPNGGTVMSYCHLTGTGVNLGLGFGQQPGDLIRNSVANANCLTPCDPPTCTDGYLNGNETEIDCGGPDCPACPTCTDGLQNGTEAGVDCGGVDCFACPCSGGTGVSLIINPDFYTTETTWDFKDASGNIVASGGPYANGLSNIVEAICLPPGCYDFTIYDSYGDGLFDGNITGVYDVIDENGNVLANGTGNFGASETSNFCVSSSCASVDLDILFDGFPGQTSWDITDNSGTTVASGGSYGSQTGNSTLSTSPACLPDGCYTLNFYDAIGNGMCPFQSSAVGVSTFITPGTLISPGSIVGTLSLVATPGLCGNYSLKDANGTVLVSGGGGFGATESNSFCISGGLAPKYTSGNSELVKNERTLSNAANDLFNILPNPVIDQMMITTDFGLNENIDLQVIDVLGKVVMQQTISNHTISEISVDVHDLKTGVYLVQLFSNDEMISKKFVKQ